MIRLHVSCDLAAGAGVVLEAGQAHYLTGVMRLKSGGELLLFNGRDGEWRAVLVEASRRGARLEVRERVRPQPRSAGPELLIALIKRSRLETVIEKATELGVAAISPVITRRTNSDHARPERLLAIATEAAEQTGRLDVPALAEPRRLEAVLEAWPADRRLVFCDEAGEAPPLVEAIRGLDASSLAVLIGPEGGFAPEERARLRDRAQVVPVGLGPRILRADTAAIAALSLVQAVAGDWRREP